MRDRRMVLVGGIVAQFWLSNALAGVLTITPLLTEGQDVAGVGLVTRIDNLAVNDAGAWVVEADTDNADTNTDSVLIKSGLLYLREGQALAAPAGTTIQSFDTVALNAGGHSGWNFFLGGAPTNQDSGIFCDDHLVLQEGTISTAPQLSPNTPYIGFFEVKTNNLNQLLVMASVDDPAIATTVDRALVVMNLDNSGDLASETVLYKEGDQLPGQTETVADFGTGPHSFAFNDAGQALYIADLTGDTTQDGVVYLNGTELAQEGDPSPVAGRNWAGLTSARVDLNRFGQYVYTGTLSGDATSDNVIIKNNTTIVAQEGSPVPQLPAFTFTGFGTGPVLISNQGRVLWYGDWSDADTTVDEGLFLDDLLLVQEGATTVNGVVIDVLRGIQNGYAMSPNGRYIVFEAVLVDGTEGAYQIEMPSCPCAVVGGCHGGDVDLTDLTTLLAAFGTCSGQAAYRTEADFDFSGCIELGDLTTLLASFGTICP